MKKGIESLGRLRAQGLVLLGLAFVSGGLAGIAIEHARLASRARGEAPPMPRSFPRRGLLPPQLERFDLSQEQRSEIEAILERTRPATDSILRGAMPRLGEPGQHHKESRDDQQQAGTREGVRNEYPILAATGRQGLDFCIGAIRGRAIGIDPFAVVAQVLGESLRRRRTDSE